MKKEEKEIFVLKVYNYLKPFDLNVNIDFALLDVPQPLFTIEPTSYKKAHGSKFDGMQIIFEVKTGIYEVSEFMAGKNESEIWIYRETKNLFTALNVMLKGNKRKPIKVWN